MKLAFAKREIESVMTHRFGAIFDCHDKRPTEILPTGINDIDGLLNGFPRGAITEIHGAASSGRTSLFLSTLSLATTREETCALIDCDDTFDLLSAENAGVDFNRLLWVRCGNNLERAFKAVDLLLHSGGFGLVVLNLSDVAAGSARRIISSWWFRFRRALENTPSVLVVITRVSCVRSCAALVLEVRKESTFRPGTASLLPGCEVRVTLNRSENLTHNLSLVPARLPVLPLTHTHLMQGMEIQVSRERPLQWSGLPVKFRSYKH